MLIENRNAQYRLLSCNNCGCRMQEIVPLFREVKGGGALVTPLPKDWFYYAGRKLDSERTGRPIDEYATYEEEEPDYDEDYNDYEDEDSDDDNGGTLSRIFGFLKKL